MIRRTVLAAIAAMVFIAPAAGPAFALDRPLTPEETQLITEINQHNTDIRSMAGRFQQIDSDGNQTEGTFFLVRPDKIAFRYAPPSREAIVSVGRGFYVLNRRDKTKKAYPQDQVPLRFFLADKIDLFKANIVAMATTDAYSAITISDESVIGTVNVALIFDVKTKDLVQWVLTDPGGQQLTVSLYDVVTNVDIPKAIFYIDPTYRSVNAN